MKRKYNEYSIHPSPSDIATDIYSCFNLNFEETTNQKKVCVSNKEQVYHNSDVFDSTPSYLEAFPERDCNEHYIDDINPTLQNNNSISQTLDLVIPLPSDFKDNFSNSQLLLFLHNIIENVINNSFISKNAIEQDDYSDLPPLYPINDYNSSRVDEEMYAACDYQQNDAFNDNIISNLHCENKNQQPLSSQQHNISLKKAKKSSINSTTPKLSKLPEYGEDEICHICNKSQDKNRLFLLRENKNFMCLFCSTGVNNIRHLGDWEKTPIKGDYKTCYRCNCKRSKRRFNKGGRLCAYCMLKKKYTYFLQKQQNM